MEFALLPAEIKKINRQLESHYGINTDDMRPMWRISWSNDQYEKRMTDRTDGGIILLVPEVRELPKYQWIKSRWILENLTAVPKESVDELGGSKTSYECIWNFSGKGGGPVPPTFEACQFLISLIESAKGRGSMFKYVDPDTTIESQNKRIQELYDALFGDESSLEGKTFKGEGIVVPNSYEG